MSTKLSCLVMQWVQSCPVLQFSEYKVVLSCNVVSTNLSWIVYVQIHAVDKKLPYFILNLSSFLLQDWINFRFSFPLFAFCYPFLILNTLVGLIHILLDLNNFSAIRTALSTKPVLKDDIFRKPLLLLLCFL